MAMAVHVGLFIVLMDQHLKCAVHMQQPEQPLARALVALCLPGQMME